MCSHALTDKLDFSHLGHWCLLKLVLTGIGVEWKMACLVPIRCCFLAHLPAHPSLENQAKAQCGVQLRCSLLCGV